MNQIMANVPGRTVCDPYMGTRSTGVATLVERITAAWTDMQRK